MAKSRFHSILEAKIKEQVDSRAASLVRGAAKTYDQYQYNIGYVQAMDDVLKLCDEIEGDLS